MTEGFVTRYTVTIGDINYGGHLGNERPFVIFHEARIRLFRHHGFTEADIGDGLGIVVVEASCRYVKEVFLHDELDVRVVCESATARSCIVRYVVHRFGDQQKVFEGQTTLLPFDYQHRRVVVWPESFIASLGLDLTSDSGG